MLRYARRMLDVSIDLFARSLRTITMTTLNQAPQHRSLVLLASTLSLSSSLLADPPATTPTPTAAPTVVGPGPLAPRGYPSPDTASDRLLNLANGAIGRSSIAPIAVSREGRAIGALILGNQDFSKKLPALLLVGGMDGVNLASTEQVCAAVSQVLRDHPALLDSMRIYAIPEANPDARAWAIAQGTPRATNARQVDDDRDGALDEDPPFDFTGEGQCVTMRRVAPAGETATHLIDAVDPRILRVANKDKGERATHEVTIEAIDHDLDGKLGEDAIGGTDLDRNFPHRWAEFAIDAGPYPLSEPESMGIARFVRDHPDIVSAVVFGRHDTLVNFPDTKDKDSTGRTPMVYLAEDHAVYRDFAKLWKDSTKLEKSETRDLAGSLVLWLADHRGIAAVAANGWSRPEVPKVEAVAVEGAPAPTPAKETGDAEQAAWLEVSDKLYGSEGFIPWAPHTHAIWGDVEIGGFAPFFRVSPTWAQANVLSDTTAKFIIALCAKAPAIEVSEPRITALANGLAKVQLRVTNIGSMATTTEMGRTTSVIPPMVVRLINHETNAAIAPSDVLSGRPVNKIERLAPGASQEYSWLVRMPATGALDIAVSGPTFDTITRSTQLSQETSR